MPAVGQSFILDNKRTCKSAGRDNSSLEQLSHSIAKEQHDFLDNSKNSVLLTPGRRDQLSSLFPCHMVLFTTRMDYYGSIIFLVIFPPENPTSFTQPISWLKREAFDFAFWSSSVRFILLTIAAVSHNLRVRRG